MWHKNATIFGIRVKALNVQLLDAQPFHPATDLQVESCGWAPVFEGAMYFQQGNQLLLNFMVEKKSIPGSAIKTALEARVAELVEAQGFAPGKKVRKELKERVIDELLPRALPTRASTAVWIDLKNQRLIIDSTSTPRVDAILKLMIKTIGDLGVQDVSWPMTKSITHWLAGEEPEGFTTDDEVTLAYPGEHGKVVKYSRANLSDPDVQRHVQVHAASVESMAMTFDSRLSFVMTDRAQIRRIKALDVIQKVEKDADAFASDFSLMTLELTRLIDALVAEA